VTLDTVRADHTSAYGYTKKTTPALTALAKRGTLFEHAYAPGSDTQRALMPLASGLPLSKTPRTKTEWPTILREAVTVAERMKKRGYATAAISSFTWLRRDRGFDQGFDHFDESPFRDNHPERKTTGAHAVRNAIALYQKLAKKDAPLFLWLHLFDAHANYLPHKGIDFGRGEVARYDGEIAYVDQQLAKLVKAVEGAPQRAKRTVWVVHGSHGEAFDEHGFKGHGTQLYEEVIRVPLVVVPPSSGPQRFSQRAVSTFDIAPTLLDYAGANRDNIEGVSLRGAIAGRGLSRPAVVAHAWRRSVVIDWPLKLLTYRRRSGKRRLLLFDLVADPGETKDLSGVRKDDLRRLIKLRKQRTGS